MVTDLNSYALQLVHVQKFGMCLDLEERRDTVLWVLEQEYPDAAGQILKKVAPQSSNDVIIIAGAETLFKAKIGAFAAAWSLLDA